MGLAIVVVGLEVGFLLAYRAGWNISLAAIVSNASLTLLLIPIGMLLFRERPTPVNLIGVAICVAGLAMANLR